MAFSCNIPRCQHIKVNGIQCGSPALRGQIHCYFHHQWRLNNDPAIQARDSEACHSKVTFVLPPLEDANSIQLALMEVMRLIVHNLVDNRQAGLLLYALQTAGANLKRLSFEPNWRQVVVNPAAACHTPLIIPDDQSQPIGSVDQVLERFRDLSNEEIAAGKKPAASIESATVATGVKAISPHPLPLKPEDWEKLKNTDFASWALAYFSVDMDAESFRKCFGDPQDLFTLSLEELEQKRIELQGE